jgi:hypothetical protein
MARLAARDRRDSAAPSDPGLAWRTAHAGSVADHADTGTGSDRWIVVIGACVVIDTDVAIGAGVIGARGFILGARAFILGAEWR